MFCCKKKNRRELDENIDRLEATFLKIKERELKAKEVEVVVNLVTRVKAHYLQGPQTPGKPSLVFIHGFGTSCASYVNFLEEIMIDFNVYAIDLVGMGCSGKPDLEYIKMTTEEVLTFYVDFILKTVEALGLKDFHLVAHSLGAFLSFNFLKKHGSMVKTFTAVSSAGMTSEPPDFAARMKAKKLPCKSKFMRWFWLFMNKGYIKGHTAFSCLPTGWLIKKWTSNRFEFEGEERKAITELIVAVFKHPGFSVDVLPKILGYRAYSNCPISAFLHQVERQVPVMHVFGEKDWMDKYALKKFIDESKFISQDKLESRIEYIKDSGHHIPNFHPKQLATLIKSFVKEH